MKLFRLHLLPRVQELWDSEDRKIVLGDNFDKYASSLQEYVRAAKPSLLLEHDLDGNSYGKIIDTETTEQGIFGIAEVPDPSVMDKKRFVSPRIRWNHTDIDGRRWPAALLETSFVSVPRFQIGQQEIESINSALFPDNKEEAQETKFSEINLEGLQLPIEEINNEQPTEEVNMTPELELAIKELIKATIMEMEAAEEAKEVVEETVAAEDTTVTEEVTEEATEVATEVATEESTMEEDLEVVELEEVEDMETETLASKVSKMSPEAKDALLMKLAEYLSETKKETVMSAIKSDMKSRGIDEAKVDGFYKLYKTDKAAYESTMSAFGKPATQVVKPVVNKPSRQTPVVDSTMSGASNMSPVERALADVRAGKSTFADALAKYNK